MPYTEKHNLGAFEGNKSQLVASILHSTLPDEELGDVQDFGWYGLILGKRYGFIVHQDSYGSFVYSRYSLKDARKKWHKIEKAYVEFNGESTL